MAGVACTGCRPAPTCSRRRLACARLEQRSRRPLAGILAAQGFVSELTGDESLSKRPMDRIVKPLTEMGAHAQWPPLRVGGRLPLQGIEYPMPVPSAQVKSALLLAGLFAEGTTAVIEPVR